MIDVLIPFLFGLMVGAGGGVMIAALLVASRESEKIGEKTGRWIPVTERLPGYMEPVLTWDGCAYCVEKRIPYIRDDDGEPIEGNWWVSDDYDEYDSDYYPNLRDGACIAWQPLPEPYQKGEQ